MLPSINPKNEIEKIKTFLKKTLQKTGQQRLVVACSGGIDSSLALALAIRAIGKENVYALLMPYNNLNPLGLKHAKAIVRFVGVPDAQIFTIDIKPVVDTIKQTVLAENDNIRFGNIMARVRMIVLYDFAKKYSALVCGTENKSEYYLGYFTRFGDEASDIEPLQHLYKTQVYELAKALRLPHEIISQRPTAGLWPRQTDEGEFGFSYDEADHVLYRYFDKQESVEEIAKKFPNAQKIIDFARKNEYKHKVPYTL